MLEEFFKFLKIRHVNVAMLCVIPKLIQLVEVKLDLGIISVIGHQGDILVHLVFE